MSRKNDNWGGDMSGPSLRHLSVRVPWHDQRWNGTVCANPAGNDACLVLKAIGLKRDDLAEQRLAGQSFEEIEPGRVPPCVRERSGFLVPAQHDVTVRLQYSEWSPEHKHILPTPVRVPAWGATLVPFRWMLRENAWTISEEYGLEASPDQEPEAPEFLAKTDWVQDWENQKILLECFSRLCKEEESLVFFYAKRTPLADDDRRVVVAVATLGKMGDVKQYDYEGGTARGRIRSMVWERPFQHSLRPHPTIAGQFTGGIVLPYHEILARAETDRSIDPAHYLACPPDEAREQFSYASEHVTHGTAISTLLACKVALERAAERLEGGPWTEGIAWIDEQVNRLWKLQGPCPGLGSALSALQEGFNGTLFALSLSSALGPNEDPWPLVDRVLRGDAPAPAGAPRVTGMLRRRWAHLADKQPRRAALLRLLSRFELTKQQAMGAFGDESKTDALLENPYLLYEGTRTTADPVGLWTIDRGLYPGDVVLRRHPLPAECGIDPEEPDQPSRLRAACVAILEDAAGSGDTLLPAGRISAAAAALPATRPVPLDATLLEICEDDFKPEIVHVPVPGRGPWLQLARYADYRHLIRQAVEARLDAAPPAASVDWRQRLDIAFGPMKEGDTEEERARAEKASALATLAASQFAVLTGPAGTGKTTVLKQLLNEPSLVGPGVVLLAPTGKARVRLGLQTERPDRAQTVAQFLNTHMRYDSQTCRYFPDPRMLRADGATVCVIDEASMLTEDQLAAVVDALPATCRLILVGDHRQLPPIGAGRPFVDVIAHLNGAHGGAGVAELTVRRRQAAERGPAPRDLACADVQLAELFSGRDLPPGEDEILNAVLAGRSDERLRFVEWSSPDDLRTRLGSVLKEELKLDPGDPEGSFALTLGGRRGDDGCVYFDADGPAEACEAWQILTPHRAQPMGAIDLNRHVKAAFRPGALRFARESNEGPAYVHRYRTVAPQGPEQICYGDKVICLRNHERNGWLVKEKTKRPKGYLANGEIGVVVGEDFKGSKKPRRLKVHFASQAELTYSFKKGDFSEEATPILELAYAVTVHKAQGSEFGTVFLVLPARSRLLSRELLYTALTRQKGRVVVMHQGSLTALRSYRSPFYSETARRLTNLFAAPSMVEAPPPASAAAGAEGKRFLEEKLVHRTARGDLVRSKSEIVIADALYEAEQKHVIRYRVEEQLVGKDGSVRWPDFTIEDARRGIWYWEHCGMLDQPDYRARWKRKLAWYMESGIAPWSPDRPDGRLIVTHDSPREGLDSAAIRRLINVMFAPAP
ncbi:AAA family ATPase [Azospirillum brasilense]|nr:AAA family ATPase [Azospirillum brasilense]